MKNVIFIIAILIGTLTGCNQSTSTTATTNTASVSASTTSKGNYEITSVKDEFGAIIPNKKRVGAIFKGTVRNSITDGDELSVVFIEEDSVIGQAFYEGSLNIKASLPDNELITVKVKLKNGEVKEIKEFFYNNMLTDTKKELFNLMLTQKEPFKMLVDLGDISEVDKSVYCFDINPEGFGNAINESNKK